MYCIFMFFTRKVKWATEKVHSVLWFPPFDSKFFDPLMIRVSFWNRLSVRSSMVSSCWSDARARSWEDRSGTPQRLLINFSGLESNNFIPTTDTYLSILEINSILMMTVLLLYNSIQSFQSTVTKNTRVLPYRDLMEILLTIFFFCISNKDISTVMTAAYTTLGSVTPHAIPLSEQKVEDDVRL